MIITCPNCNKKFKIDNSLILDKGRDLQCGSCNHVWFYNHKDKNEALLKFDEYITESKIEPDIETKDIKLQQKKTFKPEIKKEISKNVKKSTNIVSKLFSYLIVFIISFTALIILLDTLKTPLNNAFPRLEIILFNLFETLKDIKLFIIDLI